jgi:hypothetical protein
MIVKYMLQRSCIAILLIGSSLFSTNAQQIAITIDANAGNKAVSPYIYGKNNSTSSDPGKPTTTAQWTQIKESGVTILRENSGNECTKYNWERKLVSKPDWYNEVAVQDWDYEAQSIQTNLPGMQAMYGFQLLGYAAKSKDYNWDAWGWYVSHGNKWLNHSPKPHRRWNTRSQRRWFRIGRWRYQPLPRRVAYFKVGIYSRPLVWNRRVGLKQ